MLYIILVQFYFLKLLKNKLSFLKFGFKFVFVTPLAARKKTICPLIKGQNDKSHFVHSPL